MSQLKFVSAPPRSKSTRAKSKPLAFGSVVIEAPRGVTSTERRQNIRAGQHALARAQTALAQPGVKLDLAPEIPKYHVDARGRLVQTIGDTQQIVELVDGEFIALE